MKKLLVAPLVSYGVGILVRAGLFGVVFLEEGEQPQNEAEATLALARCTYVQELLELEHNVSCSRISIYLAALLFHLDVAGKVEKKSNVFYNAILNGLRLSHADAAEAVTLARGAHEMRRLVEQGAYNRVELGMCVRACGTLWSSSWVLALATKGLQGRGAFELLRKNLREWQLDGVWKMRPLLDGREIARLLRVTPGPIFSVITDRLIEEQLRCPDLTLQGAEEFLKELKIELKLN